MSNIVKFDMPSAPKRRRRAVELFSRENNFKSKVIGDKTLYKRNQKHRKSIYSMEYEYSY
jgi:hypothetical protein